MSGRGLANGRTGSAGLAVNFGNLSVLGEESEDEDREDEIKQLLAREFSNDTFVDDDEDVEQDRGLEEEVMSAPTTLALKSIEARDGIDESAPDNDGGGGTVSHIHRNHCPAIIGGGGDTNGNYDGIWSQGEKDCIEEMKTVAEFRERQIQRAEEKIETLSKDKRALAHQAALLRTEVLRMKCTEDELQKTLKLKDEETEFLKTKVDQIMHEFEVAKKCENEVKDQNMQLQAQIGKLAQEVKLLSAIGLSTKESELNDAVRDIRQKHSKELTYWKDRVAGLEEAIKQKEALQQKPKKPVGHKESQTSIYGSIESSTVMQAELQELAAELSYWKERAVDADLLLQRRDSKLKSIPETKVVESKETQVSFPIQDITELLKRDLAIKIDALTKAQKALVQERNRRLSEQEISTETVRTLEQKLRDMQSVAETPNVSRKSVENRSLEVQTDETLETYRILGALIESWVAEVAEASGRADEKELEVNQLIVAIKELRGKFQSLKKVAILCRDKWKVREETLMKQVLVAYNRHQHFLTVIQKKCAEFMDEDPMSE